MTKIFRFFFSSNFQASLDCRIVEMEAQEINLLNFFSSLHSSMSYWEKIWSSVFGLFGLQTKNNQDQPGPSTSWHNTLPHLHPQPQILTGCKNPSVNHINVAPVFAGRNWVFMQLFMQLQLLSCTFVCSHTHHHGKKAPPLELISPFQPPLW